MKYSFIELTIQELVELIEKDQIDLNPSYQRNFIWSPKDQKELIDTIILDYPLPSFFMYKKPDGKYEMVDGQQRSRTIFRFVKGQITSSKKTESISYSMVDDLEKFNNYRLPIVLIEELSPRESLSEYYVWINKKGVHLNSSEMIKSEYHDTNFLKLASELLTYQKLIDLDIFSETTSKRMNDRAFIEELLGYLKLGIKEKKKPVDQIYEEDITSEEYSLLKNQFQMIIDIIHEFNQIKPINSTRYKQKNDFYTLFNFLDENSSEEIETLKYQYMILLLIDGKDNSGRQHIRPTNEDCESLKNYALNCVSQSNSKLARGNRLDFFNAILKNSKTDTNEIFNDVWNYLTDEIGLDLSIKQVGNFKLINIDQYGI